MLYLSPFITVYCCALAAVFGACMASFLNCFAFRIVHGESVLGGRSHCDVCGHVLGVKDLFPIFSYIFSKGRCRYCGAKLSVRHVLGEAVAAIVFVAALLKYDISLQVLEAWLFASMMFACAFADLEGYIIPNRFIVFGVALYAFSFLWQEERLARLIDGTLGGFAVCGVLLAIVLIMEKAMGKEAMGGGDIKLLFVAGLFLGWKGNILCLLAACIFGIVFGLACGKRREPIPWGPSICASAILTYLYGGYVLDMYMSLF